MIFSVPRVGVGVLVFKGDRVLLGKRLGSLGEGLYALPGGHLEFGESFEDCAIREVEEETGININKSSFVYAINTVFNEKAHYATIFMKTSVTEDTEAQLREPNKCEKWIWSKINELPNPLFSPLQALLDSPADLSPPSI
mmetsp:Transcript_34273/g.61837  ORF Transcript_34273/g.61837 Transcript_34273/m.61837 type:complete len:140 (-) Transcript_34273:2438-2857(-)